jgi:hypothetical protein
MKANLYLIYFILLVAFCLNSCKEEIPLAVPKSAPSVAPGFVEQKFTSSEAKNWFDNAISNQTSPKNARIKGKYDKEMIWRFAVSRSYKGVGQTMIIPIKFSNEVPVLDFKLPSEAKNSSSKELNFAARLLIWKDKQGNFQYRIHNILPDENYRKSNRNTINDDFSGVITITDYDGNFLEGYQYRQGKIVGRLNPAAKGGRLAGCAYYEMMWYTLNCINGNCSGPYYTHSDFYYVCTESDHGSDGYTPSPGAGSTVVTNNYDSGGQYVYQVSGGDTETNLNEELKCFGGNANSLFRVIVYVDQVWPGYRPFQFNASSSGPGHVYLGLEQYTNGSGIVRNIGYYPNGDVTPITPSTTGKTKSDDRYFDVSLTIEVTQAQFLSLVTTLKATSNSQYNLNSQNCTHYVLDACSAIGINLPRTAGVWWGGGGLNPSDLGEDIRAMTLSSNMTRDDDGGYPLPKQGSCP